MSQLETNSLVNDISLGYMSIWEGKWTAQQCFCKECLSDGDDEAEHEDTKLDPMEIVIHKQDITVEYRYPLEKAFPFKHHTENQAGFTRKEISEQIMERYHKIYSEEDEDVDGKVGNIPGMLNRQTTTGRYGIWGHCIEDLQLHSLSLNENGTYSPGIDS